jgi:parvulin-like peptidyl-prolyl isomerase
MSEIFTEQQISELGLRRLWRPMVKARLVEEASASFEPAPDELRDAWESFCKNFKLDAENPATVPTEFSGCQPGDLKKIVERDLRISRWKNAVFGPEAPGHFEKRKPALDRVVYSLLRVKEAGLARELWFRLKEGEATFAELAPTYASGNEVYTAGIVGPVAFGAMHPALAAVLKSARAGELLKPFAVAEWFLVARVDHLLPCEFDEAVKNQMIEELCHAWMETKANERQSR